MEVLNSSLRLLEGLPCRCRCLRFDVAEELVALRRLGVLERLRVLFEVLSELRRVAEVDERVAGPLQVLRMRRIDGELLGFRVMLTDGARKIMLRRHEALERLDELAGLRSLACRVRPNVSVSNAPAGASST